MTARRQRAHRVADMAQRAEDLARHEVQGANQRLRLAVEAIDEATGRTRQLAGVDMAPALRGLLVTAGARNLALLDERCRKLGAELDACRHRWETARQRTRSLQKLVERIEVAEAAEQRRVAAAELLDVVASSAVAGPRHQHPEGGQA